MNYERALFDLQKKSAKALRRRGLSCKGLRERCKKALLKDRRNGALWLDAAGKVRREAARFGRDWAVKHARGTVAFVRGMRLARLTCFLCGQLLSGEKHFHSECARIENARADVAV